MKEHKGMMDNRKVKDSHQEGIGRVLQRKGDMEVGQKGKMNDKGHGNWSRPKGKATTPRGA